MVFGSISPNASVVSTADKLLKPFDSNADGQLSIDEFSNLLANLVSRLSPAAAGALNAAASAQPAAASTNAVDSYIPPATTSTPAATSAYYQGQMLGFDLSRVDSAKDSPKYAFCRLAMDLAPTAENMHTIATKLGLSVGHLDSQDNFMLDADAGGYIGVRDRGNGPSWQWMAYNDAHPGPNGETT